jgi:hypothetical protein
VTIHEVITALRPADQAASEHSTLRKVLSSVVVIIAYLLIGIVAFWPVYPGISQHLFSNEDDLIQTVWFLNWVPHALAHGLNPFFSNALYVPTGVNLAQNTSTPLLGWITAPFAPVFSPVVRANLLMVLAMPLSATAAFVVLRKWQVWGPAAAVGGLIYGFSPYMVGQSLAHLELLFVPLPPFIALTVASILQNRGSSRRLGVQLGLLVAGQYLISPEMLAIVVVLTVAAVACIAIRNPADVPKMVHTASSATGIALVVGAVLLAYPIWMSFYGPQHFTGPPGSTTNPWHNDLLSFLAPTPQQRVPLGMRSLGTRLILGSYNTAESDGYIGFPVLILSGILAWRSRRSPRTQLAVVLMLGAALLSLGPNLAIDGRLTDIPLPFLLLDHLPLLNAVLPNRISLGMDACLAAVIAFGLDDMRRAPERKWLRVRGSTAFAVVTVAVLVATQLPQWPGPYTAQGAVALPTALTRAIPAGDPVAITYPYDTFITIQPMLWQAEGGFKFRLLGGYAYHPDSSGHATLWPSVMNPPGLQQFLASSSAGLFETPYYGEHFGPALPVSPELVATTRTALSKYDVRLVIVDRSTSGSGPVMELFNDALGPPMLSAGQFSMWAGWHGRPSHEEFLPHIVTSVVLPANDATLSGTAVLDARATGFYRITKTEFFLTDEDHHRKLIAEGIPTLYGWLAKWSTTSVANGTYSLQSIAYDAFGASNLSTGIPITVKNQ